MSKIAPTCAKTLFLLLLIACFFAGRPLFAQCGNYFKTNYRAVGTLNNANDAIFKLDDWTGDGRLDYWNFQVNSSNSTQNIIIYPAKTTGYWEQNVLIATTLPRN
jgi:hypothetical protein